MEQWSVIDEFPNYAVSNHGRIQNLVHGRIMAPNVNQRGAPMAGLYQDDDNRQHKRSIALLVANAFLQPPDSPNDTPIHLDGDKANAHVDNLMWRPRWFAIAFHKQFKSPPWCRLTVPLIETETQELFPGGSLQVASRFGLLEKQIYKSVINGTPCLPTWQYFTTVK